MANVSFALFDLDNKIVKPSRIVSYELTSEADAPCDGLRLTFIAEELLPEIYMAQVLVDNESIFSGFVDTQREVKGDKGFECFLYCRSSASRLLDTEAKPCVYTSPSAKAIFDLNFSEDYTYDLGDIFSERQYQISKGTSVFGALNSFVYSVTGKNIRVTPNNSVCLLEGDGNYIASREDITGIKRCINRGNALSGIDYKISNDTDYKYHRVSRFMQDRKITSVRVRNASNVPDWQRETTLASIMNSANNDYISYELTVLGFAPVGLLDSVSTDDDVFGHIDGLVSGYSHIMDGKGSRTIIKINIPLDLEVISYVDE